MALALSSAVDSLRSAVRTPSRSFLLQAARWRALQPGLSLAFQQGLCMQNVCAVMFLIWMQRYSTVRPSRQASVGFDRGQPSVEVQFVAPWLSSKAKT